MWDPHPCKDSRKDSRKRAGTAGRKTLLDYKSNDAVSCWDLLAFLRESLRLCIPTGSLHFLPSHAGALSGIRSVLYV